MHFPTQWVASFCYLFLGERQKVDDLGKCYLGCHFLHSSFCWLGFAVKVCCILFPRPFAIGVGFEVITAFSHSNSCITGPGEMVADHKAQGLPSLKVLGVGSRNEITARLRGLNQNLHLLRQEAFKFLRPGCSL